MIYLAVVLGSASFGLPVPFSGGPRERGWDAAVGSPLIVLFGHLATGGLGILLLGGLGAVGGMFYARFRARRANRKVGPTLQTVPDASQVGANQLVRQPVRTTEPSPTAVSGIGGAVVQAVVSAVVLVPLMSAIHELLVLTIPGAVIGFILAVKNNLKRGVTTFVCSWLFVEAGVFTKTVFGDDLRMDYQPIVMLLALIFSPLVAFITNQIGRAILLQRERSET